MRIGRLVGARSATVAAAGALAVAAATVVGLDATGHLAGGLFADPTPTPTLSRTSTPRPISLRPAPVLAPATEPATAQRLDVAAVDRLLADPSLGHDPGAVVLDATTGQVLLDHRGATPRTPASVAKLATTAAALVALGPDARLTTRVVTGAAPGEVVLVGGGDTTLSRTPAKAGTYPQTADLTHLADQTAAALRGRGTTRVTVRVDDRLFTGPAVSPDWPPSYIRSGVVAPVSALVVDAGRVRDRSRQRWPDPALAAGRDFAALLAARGITVAPGVEHAAAPATAVELAAVRSPTVAALVEHTLATSDNDMAESLARLVAHARGRPATFSDGAAAVSDVLGQLGVPTDGMRLLGGSGLSRGSRIAPTTLAHLLALACSPRHPELRPIVTGLPVAGFTGTLDDRFETRTTGAGAGVVRAKTGTLTGVSSLAGVTPDRGGRLLAFAILANDVPGTLRARDRLDRIATTLAGAPGKS